MISDICMPDISGVELLAFAKEVSPSTRFLLITGVPTVETAIAAVNAGADRYVIKDHELVDQLRRAVQQVDETLKPQKRSWLPAQRTAPAYRPGQHHRPQRQNARDLRSDSDGCAAIEPRADHR